MIMGIQINAKTINVTQHFVRHHVIVSLCTFNSDLLPASLLLGHVITDSLVNILSPFSSFPSTNASFSISTSASLFCLTA